MAIKDILVALAPRDEIDPARNYAIAMASTYHAHLTAAAYPIVPEVPDSVLFPQFAAGLVQKVQDEAEAAVKSAREGFEQAARSASVPTSFHGFSSSVNAVTTDFAVRLCTADIGILTQHKAGDPERFGDFRGRSAVSLGPANYHRPKRAYWQVLNKTRPDRVGR
jgi:nucleotide-binding universal stress UspA family protein